MKPATFTLERIGASFNLTIYKNATLHDNMLNKAGWMTCIPKALRYMELNYVVVQEHQIAY